MSYARMGSDSDVYVIGTGGRREDRPEVFECVGCSFTAFTICDDPECTIGYVCLGVHYLGAWFETPSRKIMVEHLYRHRDKGDRVPFAALWRLINESEWGEP